jgi:hypothetical protein
MHSHFADVHAVHWQAQFNLLCHGNSNASANLNHDGQWFKCKQISIYFYNPRFWQSVLTTGNILNTTLRVWAGRPGER